ncbi:MAG TPA: class I SAM-dependent methyltransferase [Albitalea sp.]|nr:class I SAM-dependent methyltransferase [Albitalea sp.]
MADAAYWSQRLARYGHTGWSDLAVYAYDQRLRLKAIERVLFDPAASESRAHRRALDYGCGVGDFSALLAMRFEQVLGYDLSADIVRRAAESHPLPNVRFTQDADEAWAQMHDLILCVTVLQHVVDDDELERLLRRFVGSLEPGGRVVVMETLADSELHGGYLKRRTLDRLLGQFRQVGLSCIARHDFYHPSEAPTPAYARYRARPAVRLLARLANWRVPRAGRLLHRIARRAADADDAFLDRRASPTKILVFARELR